MAGNLSNQTKSTSDPPMQSMIQHDTSPAIWFLRHTQMTTFWPACIYSTYSDALGHGHDISSLRSRQPVLLADEVVIHFLGVGPNGCFAPNDDKAPNLQLLVSPSSEIVYHPWSPIDDFESYCQTNGIDNQLPKASESVCFKRAMEEADKLKSMTSLVQIQTFFVGLLQTACDEQRVRRKENSVCGESEKIQNDGKSLTQNLSIGPKETILNILKSNANVTAPIWQHLLQSGWSTVTQKNGKVFYKSPTATFSNIKPNENIFESIENACQRVIFEELTSFFIETKKKMTIREPHFVVSHVLDHIWDQMEANGWTTMQATNEIWYVKPDTLFMECVPNSTMFDSKVSACCVYLGFDVSVGSEKKVAKKKALQRSDAPVKDAVTASTLSDTTHSLKEGSKSVHTKKKMKNECDVIQNEEIVDGTSRKSNKAPASKVVTEDVTEPEIVENVEEIAPKYTKPPATSIPPFKLTFGKIEGELRSRGWTWKYHGLDWAYIMPHCQSMDLKKLVAGKDYFLGSFNLEEYLEFSGLKDDIELKLRTEHVQLYTSVDDTHTTPRKKAVKRTVKKADLETVEESNEHDIPNVSVHNDLPSVKCSESDPTRNTTEKPHGKKTSRKSQLSKKSTSSTPKKQKCASECATPPYSCVISRGSRTRNCFAIQDTGDDKKIFERTVWPKLSSQGWRVRPGKFGHDYLKPSYIEKSDMIPNFNVFHSEFDLIEYLKEIEQWDSLCVGDVKRVSSVAKASKSVKTTKPVVVESNDMNGREYQSSRESIVSATSGNITEDDELEVPTQICPLFENSEYTPTHTNRSAFKISPNVESRPSQATEQSHNLITDTHEMSQPKTPLQSLSRNLASTFTPSPKPVTLVDHARSALGALQSTHIPTRFHARENEKKEIVSVLHHAFSHKEGASLYISGAPGCGKSALVDHTIRECVEETDTRGFKVEVIRLNALALQNGSALLIAIAERLLHKPFDNAFTAFDSIAEITKNDTKNHRVGLLVLDEVDAMVKKGEIDANLLRLLSLVHSASHTFVFIGIANRIDLTERYWRAFTPNSSQNRNVANSTSPMNSQPLTPTKAIVFQPYTFESIQTILTERLGGRVITDQLLSSHGISFLARKIAAGSGDIRIALDVVFRILQRKMDTLTSDKCYGEAVPLNDMLREIKRALESKDIMAMQSLPRSMQLVLYAVFCLHRNASIANEKASFSVDQTFEMFTEIMEKCGDISKMSREKFDVIMEQLSVQGLLAASELKKRHVRLLCALHDVKHFFEKETFFEKYLSRKE